MSAVSAPLLHMDAVLVPHRSLSKRGLGVLLSVLAAYNLAIAAFLLAIGAFPVPIFLGLDFLAVVIAFRVSYAGARDAERIQVTADQVRVLHERRGAARPVWSSPTAFTRVSLDDEGRSGPLVRLRLSNQAVTVGQSLGIRQRREFAAELERAIRSARSERYDGGVR
jgi:uncharacterized membrane protein